MSASSGRLAGKRILISGTARGIGEAAQRLFCQQGASVVGCAFSAGGAERAAAELRDEGFDAHGRQVDLADPDAAREWVEWGAQTLGGIDVLYNNAGQAQIAPFAELTVEQWRSTIVRELDIYFFTTSPAWPHLQRSRGVVLNTASACGMVGERGLGFTAHAAAKGGVIAFTRQLAAEGAEHGIRANSISPGFIDSPTTQAPDAWRERIADRIHMLGRPGETMDVANLALYLASDESALATGANFVVDAGWTAGGR
jgi:NAD(P)-dependent dehydrogenase (short-subunit alcohol dehydrogenase family)